ncbi:MAG: dTDP-4-dehydrorhamnose 3,5-epimerase [Clostridia bacterium]|nr:dTDP-4-dehydrorhamnose 3,5-epimerase [Clostridia bacterium]
MKSIDTAIAEVKIIVPEVFGDARGWFYESYSKKKLSQLGITDEFVQDNRSYSAKKGTLRGLHFQCAPMSQAKLICCTKGKILDVAVDIRKGSPTFLKWVSTVLDEDNKHYFYIPKGFAHGFLTLTDNVEVLYKADEYYSPEHDGGFRFDDAEIGVDWGISDPILSEKDKNAPLFSECRANFTYGG